MSSDFNLRALCGYFLLSCETKTPLWAKAIKNPKEENYSKAPTANPAPGSRNMQHPHRPKRLPRQNRKRKVKKPALNPIREPGAGSANSSPAWYIVSGHVGGWAAPARIRSYPAVRGIRPNAAGAVSPKSIFSSALRASSLVHLLLSVCSAAKPMLPVCCLQAALQSIRPKLPR